MAPFPQVAMSHSADMVWRLRKSAAEVRGPQGGIRGGGYARYGLTDTREVHTLTMKPRMLFSKQRPGFFVPIGSVVLRYRFRDFTSLTRQRRLTCRYES